MKNHTKIFALVSLIGNSIFILLVFLLHFLRKDLYLFEHFVSEYAIGNYGWVQTIGFFSLAIGQLFLIIGLRNNIKPSITSLTTFIVWCSCIFLIAIFPTNLPNASPTIANTIHNFSALFAFISLAVTMISWGRDFKKNKNWKNLSKLSLSFGTVSFLLLVALTLSPISFRGLTQRILISLDLCWLIVISSHLYSNLNRTQL